MWHLDIPTQDELRALAQTRGYGVVSLFMPTTPITAHIGASTIAFRNLVDAALIQLRANTDHSRDDVAAVADQLAELGEDPNFWANQAWGLGVITTPTKQWTFRLPHAPTESVFVDDRAHILPLIAAASETVDAHVLCLSEGAVRLVDVASDLPPQEVPVPGLPTSAADFAGKTTTGDRTFIGRNVSAQERSALRKYSRAVDTALRPVLRADERPLVLMAPQPIAAIFRSVCQSPYLVDEGLDANAERLSVTEVAEAVVPVLGQVQAAEDARLAQLVSDRRSAGRVATDLANIAKFVTRGGVDTLILDRDAKQYGGIDDAGAVAFDADGSPLSDELALRTLQMGGRVLVVEADRVPDGLSMVAILRY